MTNALSRHSTVSAGNSDRYFWSELIDRFLVVVAAGVGRPRAGRCRADRCTAVLGRPSAE